MIIGRFAENSASGTLIGHIRTLFFESAKVVFEPVSIGTPNSPTHRLYTGDEVELGCAWKRQGKGEHDKGYYDVVLDDPTFAAPINTRLVWAKKGAGLIMIWERASRRQKAAA